MLIEIVTSSEYRKIVASTNHNDVQKHMNYEQLEKMLKHRCLGHYKIIFNDHIEYASIFYGGYKWIYCL